MKKLMNEKQFAMMYELEDGYYNACDISVDNNATFLLENGIVSHNSASSSISSILGRKGLGYFAMFGVPPNAYDMSIDKILKSDKLKDLKDILGISYSTDIQTDLNFKNIIIATDADLPGFFIRGQLLGMLYKFGKNLFEEKRVKILTTPLFVCSKNDKVINWFYDFESQRKFENENQGKGYHYEYKKGLSGWNKDELQTVIDGDGFENMLQTVTIDDCKEAKESLDNWLLSTNANKRKEMLEGYEFNILNM